jgi:glycosyltransferase involved in cell wall biosynthesis
VVRPGVNGLLFDHADPGSLGRAVVRLLDDRALLATLTAGARATVVRSVDDEADELASLYREVLAPEHAPAP